jgi:HEPN domain-containing protein
VDRKGLRELSTVRLKEAKALLELGFPAGAYYLAGYAVECALKACIAKKTVRHEFPDKTRVNASYTHNFTDLVQVAGLRDFLRNRMQDDAEFRKSWNTILDWSEQSRYRKYQQQEAAALLRAIVDRRHGVISWLRPHC